MPHDDIPNMFGRGYYITLMVCFLLLTCGYFPMRSDCCFKLIKVMVFLPEVFSVLCVQYFLEQNMA